MFQTTNVHLMSSMTPTAENGAGSTIVVLLFLKMLPETNVFSPKDRMPMPSARAVLRFNSLNQNSTSVCC